MVEVDRNALRVAPGELRRRCDPSRLTFRSTADLDPTIDLIGQDRALAAVRFAASIDQPEFNLFALGPPGTGKATAVRALLKAKARGEAIPGDWVYVNNFETSHKPRAMRLPQGRARKLADSMVEVIDELRTAVPAMFESEDYQNRRRAIDEHVRAAQEEAFEALHGKAQAQGIAILKTPMGFAMAPAKDGKVLKPEAFNELPEAERTAVEQKIAALQKELEALLQHVPRLERERQRNIRELNEELAEVAVQQTLSEVEEAFADLSDVREHLKAVERDLIRNVALFLSDGQETPESVVNQPLDSARDARFRRYMVNVMVGNDDGAAGAPIVHEDNPTLGNLIGRVEHLSQMGTLVTDFLLIKPGALHRANGGYLLLDARKVLMAPLSWEALKRALKAQEVALESPADQLGIAGTVSLAPDRIPLSVRVVLFGDRSIYYMLNALDPEFGRLFKVGADFDDTLDRTDDNVDAYAGLIASVVKRHGLKPVDAGGVARTVDEAARLADDTEKLTLHVEALADLLREADHWAGHDGRETITGEDVSRAVRERIHRSDRLKEKAQESITRGIMLVDTDGAAVGQINGLSVLSLGTFAFGRPSRITARARMGAGRLIDIEREVELGGPLHSKGVMILRGFLEGQFAHEVPLSLSASLVFEQSYGGVDGDSASSAELYALLSALSGLPLAQSLAVTGSVNQHGRVQAIGGVNEKIEGFFDLCRARGLTGGQGVLIPKSNVVHLMLREDVVAAVEAGQFAVHAVETIDQGIALLTGVAAGVRGPDGRFPEGSVNARVEARLIAFAEARRKFGARTTDGDAEKSGDVA
ncbi:MAG: AAA family ATPase [Hyphomicrobiales bacterium]|nr:AAA family ATPase [Hyphomicrobiales bacterium]